MEDYDALLKGKHNDREPLIRRAYVLMQLKEYDRSIADYTEIIKENPKDIEAYLGRAYVYEGQNDFAKGIADSDNGIANWIPITKTRRVGKNGC